MGGHFISIEGNDGAGKTTAALKVCERLRERGYDVLFTREPGGPVIAEKIREILLDPACQEMEWEAEALLYAAARNQHVAQEIVPALKAGKVVICDRYIDSSLAYQGYARNLGIDHVLMLNRSALKQALPERTFFLAVSEDVGQARMDARGDKNRLDREGKDFQRRVREGFEILQRQFPERIVRIDAEGSAEETADALYREIEKLL